MRGSSPRMTNSSFRGPGQRVVRTFHSASAGYGCVAPGFIEGGILQALPRIQGRYYFAIFVLAKDGSMLVADDWAGAIYRISFSK